MGKFEKIPAPVKSMDEPDKQEHKHIKKSEKIVDGNVIADSTDWKKTVEDMSKDKAEKLSDEILKNSETLNQIKQLKQIWEKYKNKELKDVQRKQYEDLMSTIKTELNRDVPTVIEMNNEIDINYYRLNPQEAEKEANDIANNYQNMTDVELVDNVISRNEYLWEDSKQKLNSVVNEVTNSLDRNANLILENMA